MGDLAARRIAVGHGREQPAAPFQGKQVECRGVGGLYGGHAAKFGAGLVGHAVSEYYYMFHHLIFAMLMRSAKTPAAVTSAPAP